MVVSVTMTMIAELMNVVSSSALASVCVLSRVLEAWVISALNIKIAPSSTFVPTQTSAPYVSILTVIAACQERYA